MSLSKCLKTMTANLWFYSTEDTFQKLKCDKWESRQICTEEFQITHRHTSPWRRRRRTALLKCQLSFMTSFQRIPVQKGRRMRGNLEWKNLTNTVSLGIRVDINRTTSGVDNVYSWCDHENGTSPLWSSSSKHIIPVKQ